MTFLILQLLFGIISSNSINFSVPLQNNADVEIQLSQDFGLFLNDQAIFGPGNISISLKEIKDSRCPVNVNCIRAGELEVKLDIKIDGSLKSIVLRNPTWERGGTSEIKLEDKYLLQLKGDYNNKINENSTNDEQKLKVKFILEAL